MNGWTVLAIFLICWTIENLWVNWLRYNLKKKESRQNVKVEKHEHAYSLQTGLCSCGKQFSPNLWKNAKKSK